MADETLNSQESNNVEWGSELWDQLENIDKHTASGLEFMERYCRFVKERCKIEIDYAANLKKLTKSYNFKKKENECEFSWGKAFLDILNELNDIANQHETIADNLNDSCIKQLHNLLTELKADRKRYLQDARETQWHLNSAVKALDTSKRNFEKACKDAEKANELFERADQAMNVTKAEVEKTRSNAFSRNQILEECKSDYASQLGSANTLQRETIYKLMPKFLGLLQNLDETKVTKLCEFYRSFSLAQRNVLPIVSKCLDGMESAANSIRPRRDSELVISRYKSGHPPPAEYVFEDLTVTRATSRRLSNHAAGPSGEGRERAATTPKEGKKGGTISGRRRRILSFLHKGKRDSFCSELLNLGPAQQRRRVQDRISDVQARLHQESSAREAMIKMRGIYSANPAMGDLPSVETQLQVNGKSIDKLRLELNNYRAILEQIDNGTFGAANGKSRSSSALSPHVDATDSRTLGVRLSFSTPNASRLSPSPGHRECPPTPNSVTSFDDEDVYNELDEDASQSVVRPCRALYSFNAMNEASISMDEGEVLGVLEEDRGDGWTKVRRRNERNVEEGYVPTSYIAEVNSS